MGTTSSVRSCSFSICAVTFRSRSLENFNANHSPLQHRSGFLPSLTFFQSLNFIIRNPFFKPSSSFLSHLHELDFKAQGIHYRKLVNVFEMWCNPFQRQSIFTFDTNGQVIIPIISEILNKQIFLIDLHCKISLCNTMITHFQSRPSSYIHSNAYSTYLIV